MLGELAHPNLVHPPPTAPSVVLALVTGVCSRARYITVRAPTAAPAGTKEVGMKRIIALLTLLIVAAVLAAFGPGSASAAFADNGVISSHN